MTPFPNSPWPLVPVGDVCASKERADPQLDPASEFQYVDISGVSNQRFTIQSSRRVSGAEAPSRARKRIRKDDVIVATTRPYLRSIARVSDALDGEVCSTGFCVLRPTDRILRDWLYYSVLYQGFTDQLITRMRGANYPAVTDRDVLESVIPIPPLEEQSRVSHCIRKCMERIGEIGDLRRQGIRESNAIESTIFHDFLHTRYQNSRWPTVNLGDLTKSSRYGTSKRAGRDPVGIPVLRMGNIVDGYIDYSDLKYADLVDNEKDKYLLHHGDVLINRTNSLDLVGKAATFDRHDGEWIYASYLVRIRVDTTRVLPEYVTATINSRVGRNYVLATARRAIGMVNINAREMAGFPIPLPPLKVQRRIVGRLAEARHAGQQIRASLGATDADLLMNAVLRRAFAGDL